MTVDVPFFVLAVALLWLPRSWLRQGMTIWRSHRHWRGPSWTHAPANGSTLSFGYEFTKPRNYVDLLRAAIGTAALVGSDGLTAVIRVAPQGHPQQVLGLQIGILLVGVLAQTVRWYRRGFSLAAPIFYVGGLVMGLQLPVAGLCAFAIGWALVLVVPYTHGFLVVLGIVFCAVGTFLGGISLLTFAGTGLCLMPVIISLLARRPLMVYSRRPASTRAES